MKRRSKRGTRNQILIIAAIVLIILVLVGAGIFLIRSLNGTKSLTLTPDFSEIELDVNQDYTFTVTAEPAKTDLKSLEYIADTTSATFAASAGGKAILHTSAEGTVTIYVKKSKVESNYLTFHIVDWSARQAEEAALAEAAASEEPEAPEVETELPAEERISVTADTVKIRATPSTDGEVLELCQKGDSFTRLDETDDGWSRIVYNDTEAYIKSDYVTVITAEENSATELIMTTDTVKIRATPSTDGEVLELCKKGDSFTRLGETDDGWSKIAYNGSEAYIKSDYVVVATEEEIKAAADAAAKEETESTTENTSKLAEDTTTASDATTTEDAAAKAAADAQALADAAAAQAAASAGGTISYTDKNGATTTFTQAEWDYINSYWAYTGQAEYFVHKHTCAELHALYDATH